VIPGKAAALVVATAATALYLHGSGLGAARHFVAQTQSAVSDAIAGPTFGDAAAGLQRYHDLSGTYDGAAVGGRSMAMRWTSDNGYCIEGTSKRAGLQHFIGPHGRVVPGACPHWGF
jgi:hypothetical protein